MTVEDILRVGRALRLSAVVDSSAGGCGRVLVSGWVNCIHLHKLERVLLSNVNFINEQASIHGLSLVDVSTNGSCYRGYLIEKRHLNINKESK